MRPPDRIHELRILRLRDRDCGRAPSSATWSRHSDPTKRVVEIEWRRTAPSPAAHQLENPPDLLRDDAEHHCLPGLPQTAVTKLPPAPASPR
jgi:hypothetical protein